jgi:hypothetical protein
VNDLTEIALCKIYNLKPFSEIKDEDGFTGYIAYKSYSKSRKDLKTFYSPSSAFYIKYETEDNEKRGFILRDGIERDKILENHRYPHPNSLNLTSNNKATCYNVLLGQLIVAPNPVSNDKKVIIISGISGPATFGIAQILTGCMYNEFTVNNHASSQQVERMGDAAKDFKMNYMENIDTDSSLFNYAELSETTLLPILDKLEKFPNNGCVTLFNVGVYYPEVTENTYSNDDRKIIACVIRKTSDKSGASWTNPIEIIKKKSGK